MTCLLLSKGLLKNAARRAGLICSALIYIYILKKFFQKMQRGGSHPLGVVGGGDVACRGGREESVCAGGQKVVKRRQG